MKRPLPDASGKWDRFKTQRPTDEELRRWYPGRKGLGVVGGEVSGRVDPWDFDCRQTYEAFLDLARAAGLGEVVERLDSAYHDDTAGDGVRWLVRYPEEVDRPPGEAIRLARRPKRPEEMKHPDDKIKTLIEIPSYAILAPSNGPVHPSGKPYVHVRGGFDQIAEYSAKERAELIRLARSFDEMPPINVSGPATERGSAGTRPGDIWATRTSWREILEPRGWTFLYQHGDTWYLRRPGKDHGISATLRRRASSEETLLVFSTSTSFDAADGTRNPTYDKFGAFAVLEHGGDFTAAAKALAAQGYGESSEPEPPQKPRYTGPACGLDAVLATFRKWLHLPDATPVYATLGAVAANLLPGDPVWLGIVAPPSSAKTEILNAITLLPDIYPTATLTPAALLSGTPRKQRAKQARGGLLREIGEFGILLMKDFGSVLSMRPDAKAEVLAALREIYDGSWTRHLGTEGGTAYSWSGKVGMVFGVTPVIDSHHSVIGAMGDRFCVVRLDAGGSPQFARALDHVGAGAATMRQELREAVAGLFAGERREPRPLTDRERDQLISMATVAVRIRSTVERDRQSREIESIHGAEGPARLGLALERVLAGLDTVGCDRTLAFDVIRRLARDSVPPLRRRALDYLLEQDAPTSTKDVGVSLGLPTVTARRVLEDLAAYQLANRTDQGSGKADLWTVNAESIA